MLEAIPGGFSMAIPFSPTNSSSFRRMSSIFLLFGQSTSIPAFIIGDSFQLGEPESFGDLFGFMQKTVFSGEVTAQDIYVAECMQGSFESGAIDSIYVSDAEVPVRAFQKRAMEDM